MTLESLPLKPPVSPSVVKAKALTKRKAEKRSSKALCSSGPSVPTKEDTKQVEGKNPIVSTQFSGPLPPPAILAGYDDICPGAAERLIKMVEEEGHHRRKLEETMVRSDVQTARSASIDFRIGQILAFFVTLCFVGSGCFLAYHGKQVSGVILGSSGMVAVVVKEDVAFSKQP